MMNSMPTGPKLHKIKEEWRWKFS